MRTFRYLASIPMGIATLLFALFMFATSGAFIGALFFGAITYFLTLGLDKISINKLKNSAKEKIGESVEAVVWAEAPFFGGKKGLVGITNKFLIFRTNDGKLYKFNINNIVVVDMLSQPLVEDILSTTINVDGKHEEHTWRLRHVNFFTSKNNKKFFELLGQKANLNHNFSKHEVV